jgi:hypothetical protein
MAGRFVYLLVAGAAIAGGMALQGDLKFNQDERETRSHVRASDRVEVERRVERSAERRETRDEAREVERREQVVERQIADAVAELVRAEGGLITAKLDDNIPAAALKQAEARRDAARDAVERLSDEARAASADDRDALRENIRDSVRDGVGGSAPREPNDGGRRAPRPLYRVSFL